MLSVQLVLGVGGCVVRVGGQLDADSTLRLQETADAVIDGPDRPRVVVLDCQDLDLCDSSGLSTLITMHRRLVERGGGLRLAGLCEHVARMFARTGIDQHIAVYPALALALAGPDAPAQPAVGQG